MKVALVHDYLKDFGGAERVLQALIEIWPEAPIYTAFYVQNSSAGKAFSNKKIVTSWANPILSIGNLFSPLRFLTPLIWESFDFSKFDLVISSSSWYITKGIKVKPPTVHICYCHTPPRWLYGYQTSVNLQRFWPIKIYGQVLAHFMRQYDFQTSQKVDYFIANSKEVQARIKKFYRRDSTVIYPPVNIPSARPLRSGIALAAVQNADTAASRPPIRRAPFVPRSAMPSPRPQSYFLVVSRLAQAKNIDLAISACNKLSENLWIVGSCGDEQRLRALAGPTIKFLGQVSDEKLWEIYGNCKALICTATDEDFGITPIEVMAMGRPVIAYRGGGYLETVIDSKTGLFFNEPTAESLSQVISHYDNTYYRIEERMKQMRVNCLKQAEKFSKERFKKEIKEFISKVMSSSDNDFIRPPLAETPR